MAAIAAGTANVARRSCLASTRSTPSSPSPRPNCATLPSRSFAPIPSGPEAMERSTVISAATCAPSGQAIAASATAISSEIV